MAKKTSVLGTDDTSSSAETTDEPQLNESSSTAIMVSIT